MSDYPLAVRIDHTTVADQLQVHGWVRHSHPLIVGVGVVVAPGVHHLEIELRPETGDVMVSADAELARQLAAAAGPPPGERVEFLAGRITLMIGRDGRRAVVTDPDRRRPGW